jgi:hypothetical protein
MVVVGSMPGLRNSYEPRCLGSPPFPRGLQSEPSRTRARTSFAVADGLRDGRCDVFGPAKGDAVSGSVFELRSAHSSVTGVGVQNAINKDVRKCNCLAQNVEHQPNVLVIRHG